MKDNFKRKMQLVASNIRKIREYKNYTQDYLAAKIGISQNAYSKIELGYSKISLDRFFQIAELLEVDSADLLNFNKEEFEQKYRK
ncbi:helix-turn-helix domain-containing protein [Pedobacter sp. ASV28]|jgi:transcriptional regulator with XRE-family HTH domain|uniref:helix-turn-helix domain-containing protein n=1 Tax=Pedobacter sp. ASV28 TaxID=2795123 RepID=UPI0018EC49EA|nr:helix-turn-helix transcriptional regulator [Pedobacter sp. ASV28]